MKAAFVDSSVLAAILLGESGGRAAATRLEKFDRLFAAGLLEAELRSILAREGVTESPEVALAAFSWVLPDRPLSSEYERVLKHGYVRGADLWHLACALYVAESPEDLTFLTLDERQRAVAKALGFKT